MPVFGILDSDGNYVIKYTYDAWGNILNKEVIVDCIVSKHNPFLYKGYVYDVETEWYYLQSRFYIPSLCRFLSPDNVEYANPKTIGGLNLYAYCNNDSITYRQVSDFSGDSKSIPVRLSSISIAFSPVPEWVQTFISVVPDVLLGLKYFAARGIHTKFAYAKNTRYMFPIMGGTLRWFAVSKSNFGTLSKASFKQILTGDARAGLGAIAKSVGVTVGINFLTNVLFNLIENGFDFEDVDMWIDTCIDTAIGVSSYYLASGAMSLVTASLIGSGVAVPGIVVVGGVILLSIGIEWLIRELFNYHK